MRTPSPQKCRLDLAPPLADRFIFGVASIDYGPILLLMPFGSHLAVDTLPSKARALADEALPPSSDMAPLIRAPEGLQPSRATRCSARTMPPSDLPPLSPPGSSPVALPDRSSRSALDWGGISQVPCMELRCVLGVSDRAGSSDDSRLTPSPVLPSVPIKTSASRNGPLRDSIPCPHLPLSTLHVSTHVLPRMTRGQIGSLNLICMRLALTAPMPVSLAHNGMDAPTLLIGIDVPKWRCEQPLH